MIPNIIIRIMTLERTALADNFKKATRMGFALLISGGKQSVITIQILRRYAAKVAATGLDKAMKVVDMIQMIKSLILVFLRVDVFHSTVRQAFESLIA